MTRYIAKMNGHKSVGSRHLIADPSKRVYAFRVWGKIYWSGDLENLRPTRKEAYADLTETKGA